MFSSVTTITTKKPTPPHSSRRPSIPLYCSSRRGVRPPDDLLQELTAITPRWNPCHCRAYDSRRQTIVSGALAWHHDPPSRSGEKDHSPNLMIDSPIIATHSRMDPLKAFSTTDPLSAALSRPLASNPPKRRWHSRKPRPSATSPP